MNTRLSKHTYSNIYIIENTNLWHIYSKQCNKNDDLVLCLDFALKAKLEKEGYAVEFLDHLVTNDELEPLNYQMHDFLYKWFKDSKGQDLLCYKNYSLGDSLLLFIINDVTYFCHFLFNIIGLKSLTYQKLFVAVEEKAILTCLEKTNIEFALAQCGPNASNPVYLFPINKWIREKTQRTSLTFKFKNIIANVFDHLLGLWDKITIRKRKRIYIQNYYPTSTIIDELRKDASIQLVLPNYSSLKNVLTERRIHYRNERKNIAIAAQLFNHYAKNRAAKWDFLSYSISGLLYERIDVIIDEHLLDAVNKAESIDASLRANPIDMMIPVTNLWMENRLVMNYCRNNAVPVFMIINGLLSVSYQNEGKDSDFVNCYSPTIKKEYFKNSVKAFPLGDPRMDKYNVAGKEINRDHPTIIIGTAGYSPIDLNSYLAQEFDFLYEILTSIQHLGKEGFKARIILKVRANGYVSSYSSFIKDYFSDLDIEITQNASFFDVIQKADLYLSIFSQTIFEASCLGIPVIYYKNDTQTLHSPFDGKSELVTAHNMEELIEKIRSFYAGEPVYSEFMKLEVMEKYVGSLSGNNMERNVRFIYDLLDNKITLPQEKESIIIKQFLQQKPNT